MFWNNIFLEVFQPSFFKQRRNCQVSIKKEKQICLWIFTSRHFWSKLEKHKPPQNMFSSLKLIKNLFWWPNMKVEDGVCFSELLSHHGLRCGKSNVHTLWRFVFPHISTSTLRIIKARLWWDFSSQGNRANACTSKLTEIFYLAPLFNGSQNLMSILRGPTRATMIKSKAIYCQGGPKTITNACLITEGLQTNKQLKACCLQT